MVYYCSIYLTRSSSWTSSLPMQSTSRALSRCLFSTGAVGKIEKLAVDGHVGLYGALPSCSGRGGLGSGGSGGPAETRGRRIATTSGRDHAEDTSQTQSQPVKALLRQLIAAGPPRNADALWAEAEIRGVKSKRFMKQMLKQMKARGEVETTEARGGERGGGGGHHHRASFSYARVEKKKTS